MAKSVQGEMAVVQASNQPSFVAINRLEAGRPPGRQAEHRCAQLVAIVPSSPNACGLVRHHNSGHLDSSTEPTHHKQPRQTREDGGMQTEQFRKILGSSEAISADLTLGILTISHLRLRAENESISPILILSTSRDKEFILSSLLTRRPSFSQSQVCVGRNDGCLDESSKERSVVIEWNKILRSLGMVTKLSRILGVNIADQTTQLNVWTTTLVVEEAESTDHQDGKKTRMATSRIVLATSSPECSEDTIVRSFIYPHSSSSLLVLHYFSCSPDSFAFLNWQSNRDESESKKAVVFLSLVATVRSKPALDDSLEAKATDFLKSVNPKSEKSADAFLTNFGQTPDESGTNFVQSIVVLLSSLSQAITTAAIEILDSLILHCATIVRYALVKADLIPQLIFTLNPQSLSFAEAVDIHTYLLDIIRITLWLATPYGLAQLGIDDDNEQPTVHETIFQHVLITSEKYICHLCVTRFSIMDGWQSKYFLMLHARLLEISPYYQPTLEFVLISFDGRHTLLLLRRHPLTSRMWKAMHRLLVNSTNSLLVPPSVTSRASEHHIDYVKRCCAVWNSRNDSHRGRRKDALFRPLSTWAGLDEATTAGRAVDEEGTTG
ncbi:hypothetical protein BLNAU_14337 [Blattamonas nauphoetae]|uniref:Uncharacterized protein n=1 Tax=Blattamonas nauphoetae TaxID=2049346 RepID=A0ABQ9XK95_9EUKA|nr:hypothetical protein BLNAU_14337 [Blattamonas nauphoetae]